MTLWHAPSEVPASLDASVVTIGVFDGVHRGHQALLAAARDRADLLGVPVIALTFDPHPVAVLRPEAAPAILTDVSRRAELLVEHGADHVVILPFGRDRSEQDATDFVDDVLVSALKARVVVVGEDFRFGHRAAGDVGLLRELGPTRGFTVVGLGAVGADGQRFSSTRVRQALAQGDVAEAGEVLGRAFRVDGVVVHGDRRGRELGFPTANLPVRDGVLVPADGVYAGWLQVPSSEPDSGRLPAAISVGSNPTFKGASHRVEAYVLDRTDLDLYGVLVGVEFLSRVRGMQAFDSVEALVEQMTADVAQIRDILAGESG